MYKLARRGQITEPAAEKKRRITIYSLDMLEECGENAFLIKICCSKGPYIRTLVSDIGKFLGTCAYMPFLLRTASGEFTVQDAYTIAELKELKEKGLLSSAVIPCDKALKNLPELNFTGLSEKKRARLENGAPIHCEQAETDIIYRVYLDNEFLGLGKKGEEGLGIKLRLVSESDNGGDNGNKENNTSHNSPDNKNSSENGNENDF